MPQIMPLNWILIFSCLTLLVYFSMTAMSKMKLKSNNKMIFKKTENSMKW